MDRRVSYIGLSVVTDECTSTNNSLRLTTLTSVVSVFVHTFSFTRKSGKFASNKPPTLLRPRTRLRDPVVLTLHRRRPQRSDHEGRSIWSLMQISQSRRRGQICLRDLTPSPHSNLSSSTLSMCLNLPQKINPHRVVCKSRRFVGRGP